VCGLSPGDAHLGDDPQLQPRDSDDYNGYAPIYYPGTASGQAQRPRSRWASRSAMINITLSRHAATITGTVTDSEDVLRGAAHGVPARRWKHVLGPSGTESIATVPSPCPVSRRVIYASRERRQCDG
jgi:hypothetical protein